MFCRRSTRRPRFSRALQLYALLAVLVMIPAAGAAVGFHGGLEGSSPLSGWQRVQAEPDRPLSDSFQRVTSPVRQGQYAAKITVRQGYSQFGHNEDTELSWQSYEKHGDDYYYAFSTLFPTTWQAPHKWGIFAQWHATLGTSPAVSFGARGDSVHLGLLAGKTDEKANMFEFNRRIPLLTTLSKGRWNDFVLHVRWSGRNNGVVEVWHRVAGSGGFVKKVSLSGITTLQYATARGQSPDNPSSIYVLWGLYRGSYCSKPTQLNCTGPLGTQAPSVLYHDGFARGKSFDEVAGAAFGSGSGTAPPPGPVPIPVPKPVPVPVPPKPIPVPVPPKPIPVPVPPVPVPSAANLAPNASVEADPASTWYTVSDGGSYSWVSSGARSGARALKIVSTGSGMTRWMSKAPIPVSPGSDYAASAYLKSTGSSSLTLVFWDAQGRVLGTAPSSSVTGSDWKEASVQTTAPAGAATVRIELRLAAAGTVTADDVSLKRVSAPATSPGPLPTPVPAPGTTPGPVPVPAPISVRDDEWVGLPDPTPFIRGGDANSNAKTILDRPQATPATAVKQTSAASAGQALKPGSTLTVVRDPECPNCVVKAMGRSVQASIPGAANGADSAYVVKSLKAKPNGVVKTMLVLRLPSNQRLKGNLSVSQVRDARGRVVYELYIARNRKLHFWSPRGGLAARGFEASTKVRVPNSGRRNLSVVVSAERNGSLEVRVNGVRRIVRKHLSGAPNAAQKQQLAGIVAYGGRSGRPVSVYCGGLE